MAPEQEAEPDFLFAHRPGVGGRDFYRALFKPVEAAYGPMDRMTLTSVIGFSAGGPVSLNTFGRDSGRRLVTYVTCELTCYSEQRPSSEGPFEVLMTTNDESWARTAATCIGELSLKTELDHLHSVDFGLRMETGQTFKGVVLERFSSCAFAGARYGILRAIGVTRRELEWCVEHSAKELLEKLKTAGLYPVSDMHRNSVELE